MKGRIYRKSGSENREMFSKIPGVEMEECCKCHHGELPTAHVQFSTNDGYGSTESTCSICGWNEFYVYKEKQENGEATR